MKISEHFDFNEMTFSQWAIRSNVQNLPSASELENLKLLCNEVLEPVRKLLGVPLKISSGYRNARVNKAVGGSLSSQHMQGLAADFIPIGMSLEDAITKIMASDIAYDQLIDEYGSWIHISHSGSFKKPRKENLGIRVKGTYYNL